VLAEQVLGEEHQHQQAGGEGGLHDDERGQHQRHDLQRPAEDRKAGAGEPAGPPRETPCQSEAQVLLVGGLLGVERLERDP
jgi:hypothetical protein